MDSFSISAIREIRGSIFLKKDIDDTKQYANIIPVRIARAEYMCSLTIK